MQYVPRHRQDQGKMIDYTNSNIERLIEEHIHSERDREIMKRRLIDGICFEPLAEEFDLSVSQVKRIVYKLGEKLFQYL